MDSAKTRSKNLLAQIEEETKKMYTLTLHEIGQVTNTDLIVGRPEERKIKWRVVVNKTLKRLRDEDTTSMPSYVFALEGVYNSYQEIEIAIQKLGYERGLQAELKSYSYTLQDGVPFWTLICKRCDHSMTGKHPGNMCQECWKRGETVSRFYDPNSQIDRLIIKNGSIIDADDEWFTTEFARIYPEN